jgi:hypothetical protein
LYQYYTIVVPNRGGKPLETRVVADARCDFGEYVPQCSTSILTGLRFSGGPWATRGHRGAAIMFLQWPEGGCALRTLLPRQNPLLEAQI